MKCALSCVLLLLVFSASAQEANTSFLYRLVSEKRMNALTGPALALFEKASPSPSSVLNATLSEKIMLSLKRQSGIELYLKHPASLSLIIPGNAIENYQLELVQQDIGSNTEFSFGTLEGNGIKKKNKPFYSIHYRGYIKGDPASIASFSIAASGDVMILFCNRYGNYNIGKGVDNTNEYILYNSRSLLTFPGFECHASEAGNLPAVNRTTAQETIQLSLAPATLCKKVRVYWEADYKLFSNNFASDLAGTADYLAGIFNQVATMYQNEGITIELTDSYIWITPDPYNTSNSTNGLNTFQDRWNALGDSFNADLALLLDGAPTTNGGNAYLVLPDLCVKPYSYGYVDLYGIYNDVPVYSWDVEVLTHEMGHIMGSHHTHWCGWNAGGNICMAIDDCTTEEPYNSCNTCAAMTSTIPSAPPGFQGTVMSYCHLRSGIGINLANGFGPLPRAAIRASVSGTTCTLSGNKWTGTVSTAWEDPANWGCGSVPDATTDVIIAEGLTNYPVVNSAAICHRIVQAAGTSVLVKTGFTLNITGLPQ